MAKKEIYGIVVKNECIVDTIYDLVVEAPALFSEKNSLPAADCVSIKPGQFVGIYTDMADKLLPRPVSICEILPKHNQIRLVYQVRGGGTSAIAQFKAGKRVRFLAPLGNGFRLPEYKPETSICVTGKKNSYWIVGGGIGVPPLLQLAKELCGYKNGSASATVNAVLGFGADPILVDDFKKYCRNVFVAAENRSQGFKGNALECLKNQNALLADDTFKTFYACGPAPMLKGLSDWAHTCEFPLQISLEERMACSIGACVGCAVKVSDLTNEAGFTYKKVCADGPVFDSKEVML